MCVMTEGDVLASCELFSGLGEDGLRQLSRVSRIIALKTGEYLFHQGQNADGFYIVANGVINVHRVGGDGRRQILHLLGAGDAVGEVAVFEGSDFPASAVAEESARVLFLPRDSFLNAARRDPDLLLDMLAVLSKRLRRFVALVDDLSLKDVVSRLAQYLSDASEGGDRFTLEVSKTMLASQLRTIPETLSRTFRKLQMKGVLKVDGRNITLIDKEALDKYCDIG